MKSIILFCLTSMMIITFQHIDAAIDPESIVGIWLLEEGQGKEIKILPEMEMMEKLLVQSGQMENSVTPLRLMGLLEPRYLEVKQ
ncbi:MAG: hypothetical protein OXI43_15355 [Candidatus Poribacteria bacterium]|nr:hypothetical protein [Candidatus Poribacteria bacterium]